MICQVIVNDFEAGRRVLCVLDETDFQRQQDRLDETDDLLIGLQGNDLFTGRTKWRDLDVSHYHLLISNSLNLLDDDDQGDESVPVMRLALFLCGMIALLQKRSGSNIDLFRINRVSGDDLFYDYSATMDVQVSRNRLKIVIDNDGHTN